MPDLGEGLADAEIVAWHVAAGDVVALNQTLAEVETEKAVVELPSPFAGTVVELLAHPGETVAVGAPIVTIETAASDGSGDERTEDPSPSRRVPHSSATAPLRRYRAGGRSPLDRCAASTPATRRPIRLPRRFRPRRRRKSPAPDPGRPTSPAGPSRRHPSASRRDRKASTSPTWPGTGPAGSSRATTWRPTLGSRAPGGANAATAGDPEREPTEGTRTPVRGIQKRMADAMVRSVAEAPQACVFLSVDVSESTALVERLRASRQFEGVRVTVLGLVAKSVLRALEEHPELNSSWDESRREVVFEHHVNLGIAVAAPVGLLVPNIPAAERLGLRDLADALGDLVERARSGRCAPADLRGGTFTITNVGVFGVDGGVAILNPGEAGILAVGAIRRTPWEHEGDVALRDVMTLSLTFDHRLVDGRQASSFLSAVGRVLSDPLELLAFA